MTQIYSLLQRDALLLRKQHQKKSGQSRQEWVQGDANKGGTVFFPSWKCRHAGKNNNWEEVSRERPMRSSHLMPQVILLVGIFRFFATVPGGAIFDAVWLLYPVYRLGQIFSCHAGTDATIGTGSWSWRYRIFQNGSIRGKGASGYWVAHGVWGSRPRWCDCCGPSDGGKIICCHLPPHFYTSFTLPHALSPFRFYLTTRPAWGRSCDCLNPQGESPHGWTQGMLLVRWLPSGLDAKAGDD